MKFHLRNILEKLHAESRTELAARAVREGLVGDPTAAVDRWFEGPGRTARRPHPIERADLLPGRAWPDPPGRGCSIGHKEAADGLSHRHRHGGLHHCGICMDMCPVEALDMSRPDAPGVETGPGPGSPLPWMMEHPIQVGECIGCGICIRECPVNVMTLDRRSRADVRSRRGRARSTVRPRERRRRLDPAVAVSPARRSSPTTISPWGDLVTVADRGRGRRRGRSGVDGRRRADRARRALPGRLPGRHRRGAVRRPDRRAGRYDDAYAVAAEVNPVPLGVRLDLHRAVRGRLPARRPRRADRDPDPQAVRRRARHAARGRAAGGHAARAGRDRRRRPGRHVGGVLPRPARLPRHRASRRCRCRAA